MADLVHKMYKVRRKAFHEMPPAEARKLFTGASEMLEMRRAVLPRVENFAIPAADGTPLPVRLYAPHGHGPLPVLLFLHGGGFVIGDLDSHDSLCRQLALRSGGAVLALDYRLAPEHRFPTAVDDAWAAMQWLAGQGATLGWTAAASRSAVTAPAARWPPPARCMRATSACRCRCSCSSPPARSPMPTRTRTALTAAATCWRRWRSAGSSTSTSP
jgi:acetyl esterase